MRIRRGPLFWGLLLIPLGAIPLLVRAEVLDTARFADVGRLWPLILIAIGIATILGRGRVNVIGTAVIALTIGTLGGAALATGTTAFGVITDCAASPAQMSSLNDEGTFDGDASSITIDLDCGTVDLSTAAGTTGAWTLDARYRNDPPAVSATGSSLDVRAPEGASQRQEWVMTVPPATLRALSLTANAGTASLELAGASIERLDADVNAGDLRIAAGEATIDRLGISMNAGRARLTLGGSVEGALSANAGSIELCVPSDATLRLRVEDQFTFGQNLDARGLTRDGDTWTRLGASEVIIALDIEGNAANLTLDPEGGC